MLPNLHLDTTRAPRDTTPPDPVTSDDPTTPADPATRNEERAVTTGDANLTSHLNDPAARRSPPEGDGPDDVYSPDAVGASHSANSPLARDFATPRDELARHRQDAEAADVRARRKGMAARGDVEAWREAEKTQQY